MIADLYGSTLYRKCKKVTLQSKAATLDSRLIFERRVNMIYLLVVMFLMVLHAKAIRG